MVGPHPGGFSWDPLDARCGNAYLVLKSLEPEPSWNRAR